MDECSRLQTVSVGLSTAFYPWDTIRHRLMMQSGRTDVLYKGAIHCARTILHNEGVRALYKGAMANVVRATGGALVLVLYDEIQAVIVPALGMS